MLYGKATFLPRERVKAILENVRASWGPFVLTLTGGEPTLHPEFGGIVDDVAALGLRYKIVTNGWHFNRASEHLLRTRRRLESIAFSVDGATRQAHDAWRGKGSFDRLMRAVTAARHHGLPFQFNVVLRKDTRPQMEALAILGARLGAISVNFGALIPTSAEDHARHALTPAEEKDAEREGAELANVFKMQVRVPFVLHRPSTGAHCFPLIGQAMNIDHLGRVTLCGNLSFFRGSSGDGEVIQENGTAVLNHERLLSVQQETLQARDRELSACLARGDRPDPFLASPCLYCMKRFDKAAWSTDVRA
jgi:MoaA/NifB/PqqE/SkfB family radical SAM enzyme